MEALNLPVRNDVDAINPFVANSGAATPVRASEPDGQLEPSMLARQMACSLLQVRKARGLTQSAMAQNLGLSLGQWKKYESGAEVLRSDTAVRWCLQTGVSFYRLFCDSGYRPHMPRSLCQKSLDRISQRICTLPSDQVESLIHTIAATFGVGLRQSCKVNPHAIGAQYEIARADLDENFYLYLGRGFKHYRAQHGYTQEAFANLLSVSMSSYQQYEKESSTPRFGVNILANFAMLSGLSPMSLLGTSPIGEMMAAYDERIALFRRLFEQLDVRDAQEFEAVFSYCLAQSA
jgi:transcriptional regulator with XRE-family HTH domain